MKTKSIASYKKQSFSMLILTGAIIVLSTIFISTGRLEADVLMIVVIVVMSVVFILSVYNLLSALKIEKGMKGFEASHSSFSRMYLKQGYDEVFLSPNNLISEIDGEKSIFGMDDMGFYLYVVDKKMEGKSGLTKLKLVNKFAKIYTGINKYDSKGFSEIDVLLTKPSSSYFLGFDYDAAEFKLYDM